MITGLLIVLIIGFIIWCVFKIITGSFKLIFRIGLFIFILWLMYVVITWLCYLVTGNTFPYNPLV